MNIHLYIQKKKDILENIIDFLDCENDSEESFSNLIQLF